MQQISFPYVRDLAVTFFSFYDCTFIVSMTLSLKSDQKQFIYLKLVSDIFYQIFIFHQMITLQKLWKMFFLSSLKLFSYSRYSFFLFLSSPLFLLVSHYFSGWSKINLKVSDLINWLNKVLRTHFVWYLVKKKRHGIETLSIDRVLNKEHFYGKIMQKMCTKHYSQTTF